MKYIPPATQERLKNPPKPGSRHKWLVTVIIPLIGNGWEPREVFSMLRPLFPSDGAEAVPDSEILSIIDGAIDYDPAPSGLRKGRENSPRVAAERAIQPDARPPLELINKFVEGFTISEQEVQHLSPLKAKSPVDQCGLFLLKMFRRLEHLNIVTKYETRGSKAIPTGFGQMMTYSEWAAALKDDRAVPQSEAGAWIRINPLDGSGIGNKNVKVFRYALLEMDSVPLSDQLSFFCCLPLPIAALVLSGGSSIHCWVRVDAETQDEYADKVNALYSLLEPFGVDPANKNPSRLARLPGARRIIGATGDGFQRLLYLNPNPDNHGIIPKGHTLCH